MPVRVRYLLILLVGSPACAADLPSINPAGLPGPVVLAGEKGTEDALRAFVDLAGKEKAKIVVVPAIGNTTTDADLRKPFLDRKPLSVSVLPIRDSKTITAAVAAPLAEATGVWFAGGNAGGFLKALRGTPFEAELKKLHARGGVIGGAGGGASVVGSLVSGPGKPAEGFGLLPGFVVGKDPLESAIQDHPALVGIRLADESAVVVRGRVARVLGESAITVVFPAKGSGKPVAERYPAGSLLDIVQVRRAAANRSAKAPFPPAKPAACEVGKGTLVIVGGGGASAEIWKRFIEASGGPEALIVVIPTAMDDPLAAESVEEKILKRYGARNVKSLHTRDPKVADDPSFSAILTKAGGVWFSGGRQWRFVDAYAGTLTEKRFHEVLARGGAIGGSSAGASIQSEYMPRGHPLGNTVMCAEGYEKGLCFLPGCAVDQHFFARKRIADMTGLMKKYPQYLGIGIDEGTAIIVSGCIAEVVGKSKVAFFDYSKTPGEKDHVEVAAGEKYDLKARRTIKK